MKIKNMLLVRNAKIAIGLLLLTISGFTCDYVLAGNTKISSRFEVLGKAKKIKLQDWISVKHYGPEDKPMQEFIIAFATKTYSSWEDFDKGSFRVILLPKSEMQPMLEFIQAKGNSENTPPVGQGTFRVLVYSQSVITQTLFMNTKQSLSFFDYLDSILRQRAELNEKSKHSCDRMIRFLNVLQKKGAK